MEAISLNRTPWGAAGVNVNSENVGDALAEAGLDWTVTGQSLFTTMNNDNLANLQMVNSHKAIVRDTDDVILGIVGHKWNILQNQEVFSFIDDLAKMGIVKYSSAGSFKDGKIVWVQAEYQESEILPNDIHKKHLLVTNAFDGTFSVRIGWSDMRVVCANMIRAAHAQMLESTNFTIRHTASMRNKIDIAKQALLLAEDQSQMFDAFQKSLTRLYMTDGMKKELLNTLIPLPSEGNTTRSINIQADINSLAVRGRGQDIAGVAGTGYAYLNAVSEYVNYHRTTRGKTSIERDSNRFQAALFGSGNKMIMDTIDTLNGFLVNQGLQV